MVINMVEFKTWRDAYLFLKRYNKYTCLQCKYYNEELDDNKEYSDAEYVRFFCPNQVSMVRLDFQQSCREWENENGKKLTDIEDTLYTFSDKVADILSEITDRVSIEEVEEIIKANS